MEKNKKEYEGIHPGVLAQISAHSMMFVVAIYAIAISFTDNSVNRNASQRHEYERLKIENEITQEIKFLSQSGDCYFYKRGAITFLVCDGKEICGYHNYFEKNGNIYGELSALDEIVVDSLGEFKTKGGSTYFTRRQPDN